MTIKLRYKSPEGNESKLMVRSMNDGHMTLSKTSDDFRWSAAVASFGMLLRDSEYVKGFSYEDVLRLAQSSKGEDKNGYQAEFINLIKSMGLVASR